MRTRHGAVLGAPADDRVLPSVSKPSFERESAQEIGSDPLFVDDFEGDERYWIPRTGDWVLIDGEMVQSDPEGYDFSTQFRVDVPAEHAVSVRMRALSETLGGGIVVGQPILDTRRGAYIVDFADGGGFLRWGRYDVITGEYVYISGLGVPTRPGRSRELRVEV